MPVVVPLFKIAPTLLIVAALNVTLLTPVFENVMLPVFTTDEPLKVELLAAFTRMWVTLLPMGALIRVGELVDLLDTVIAPAFFTSVVVSFPPAVLLPPLVNVRF